MTELGLSSSTLRALTGVSHRFFTRIGGTSPRPFDALNCGFTVGDAPARVEENLARVRFQIGIGRRALYTCQQVHGVNVVTVTANDDVETVAAQKADALICRDQRLAVGIRTADCVPVLLAAKDGSVVAAAHAGWRGAVGGVLQQTVKQMECDDVIAAIGPHIGPKHFEVGPEVVEAAAACVSIEGLVQAGQGDRSFIDLGGVCERIMRATGVQTIERVGGCTFEEEQYFFSHRRDQGRTGRQISVIARAEPPEIDPEMYG